MKQRTVATGWHGNDRVLILLAAISLAFTASAAPRQLDGEMHHLRLGNPREWSDFPETPEGTGLNFRFEAPPNETAWTIQLRQQDVRERWDVRLNGATLGPLQQDENDMLQLYDVPAGALKAGMNTLDITFVPDARSKPDDIRVGEIWLHEQPKAKLLSESALAVTVHDETLGARTPARITVVRGDGALPVLGTVSGAPVATRPGVVYTANGAARLTLPAGDYTVYAGRGFEYSLAEAPVAVQAGKMANVDLSIRREVSTEGYVACDTHLHTVTHSGHGDATLEERVVTIAGEGIELPIATDHNVNIDYSAAAEAAEVAGYFTPVVGNEVSTKLGHFNVFPLQADGPKPDHRADSWKDIFASIRQIPGARVIVLNHARDIHSGTRPFGPRLHNTAAGANVEGWTLEANAMEVINSGATQSEPLQLLHDWMTQLNHGNDLTPVGSSDSHDVNRYIVGQGRTYIRVGDGAPGSIDVEDAIASFLYGRVLVSYGLLVDMLVDGRGKSGNLLHRPPGAGEVTVDVMVHGPHWVEASAVELYRNGERVRREEIHGRDASAEGVLWRDRWTVAVPDHDVHLVAVATGPGIEAPYWRMAKPYQPASPDFAPTAWGATGAVWIDGDGDQQRSSALDYARRVVAASDGDPRRLMEALARYDVAVAIQAAHLWHEAGNEATDGELDRAPDHVREGFRRYAQARNGSDRARAD